MEGFENGRFFNGRLYRSADKRMSPSSRRAMPTRHATPRSHRDSEVLRSDRRPLGERSLLAARMLVHGARYRLISVVIRSSRRAINSLLSPSGRRPNRRHGRVSQDACFPCESDPYDSGAPPLVLLTPPIFQDGCDCRPEDWSPGGPGRSLPD